MWILRRFASLSRLLFVIVAVAAELRAFDSIWACTVLTICLRRCSNMRSHILWSACFLLVCPFRASFGFLRIDGLSVIGSGQYLLVEHEIDSTMIMPHRLDLCVQCSLDGRKCGSEFFIQLPLKLFQSPLDVYDFHCITSMCPSC